MNLRNSFISGFVLSACLAMLIGTLSSCNKKTETEEEIYMPASSVAITKFSLKAKNGTKVKLDSIFFSIDLNKGVIFNADSLPVGTDITRLVPVISYTQSASAVALIQSGGKHTGEINYMTNPSDTVDFSGKVVLKITAEDKTTTREYDIKVNVHKVEPDSLVWDQLAVTELPFRLSNPKQQKTVRSGNATYSLIEEADGSYTMAVADDTDLLAGRWDKKVADFGFEPDVRTLNATDDLLYLLDTAGVLHTSADGLTWNSTGCTWVNTIGAYGDVMLGMRREGGVLTHTCWPLRYKEAPVSSDFPVAEYSNFVQFSNRWTTEPIGFMVGGVTADGSYTDRTWGFDGDHWAVLSESMTPAVAGATIVPYYVYRKTSSSLVQTEFSVWMLIGGEGRKSISNRTVYVSYDNGVNWYAADTQMQLPKNFPSLRGLDGIVTEWPKEASLTDNWTAIASRPLPPMARLKYEVKDYEVKWDCPYIYIFGGINGEVLNDEVWRGVLNRLTFVPQF